MSMLSLRNCLPISYTLSNPPTTCMPNMHHVGAIWLCALCAAVVAMRPYMVPKKHSMLVQGRQYLISYM